MIYDNVYTHYDPKFTSNVLMNHLTSHSESMVHYECLHLSDILVLSQGAGDQFDTLIAQI